MKKKYITSEFEIFNLADDDIITTSGGNYDPDPVPDGGNPLDGTYDPNGWV